MDSEIDKAPYKAWLAELGQVMTRRDIAVAMREFVRAHPQLWEPDDDPGTRDKWTKGAVTPDVLANNVGRWIGGSVPGPNILKRALVSVVEGAVPEVPDSVRHQWPGCWEDFGDALKAADTSNRSGQKRGGAAAKRKAQLEHVEKTANVVRAAGRPDDIDPAEDLLLGSSLFGDELPPYVARTADALVAARLADPDSTPITVIVGPPKSGKTRSLFQQLSAMTPQPIAWWHNPAPGALDSLIARLQAVKNDPARPDVVILDDAGYNGVTPDTGLTAPRIRKIASLTTSVVLIVHSADLASWRDHATGGRSAGGLETMIGIGASPVLVKLLEATTVDYAAELDDTELAAASQMLTDNDTSDFEGLDLTRLAEAMATVDKLHVAVQAAYKQGGMRAALVEAAIDATITDPAGADIDWLQTLTMIHYRRLARNARWKPAQFDKEFDDWATTGFSPGSPHSILTRTNHVDEHYRLLDALVPKFRTSNRTLDHIRSSDLTVEQMFHCGSFSYWAGHVGEASRWWRLAADQDHIEAAYNLGVAAQEIDTNSALEGRTAVQWWRLAANRGHSAAAHNLGVTARRLGPHADVQGRTANKWAQLAAGYGHPGSAHDLGNDAAAIGPDARIGGRTAVQWWRFAFDNGNVDSALHLGNTADRLGADAIIEELTATQWWRIAADKGNPTAAYNLGVTTHDYGPGAVVEGRTAVQWWLIAASSSHVAAVRALGLAAEDLGINAIVGGRTAAQWWRVAADLGCVESAYSLGNAAYALGPDVRIEDRAAVEWWRIAADQNHRHAAWNLGAAAIKHWPFTLVEGRTANQWFAIAARHGHAGAAFHLGNIAHQREHCASIEGRSAVEWWHLASNLNHANAAINLGVTAVEAGPNARVKGRTAGEWLAFAADRGSRDAALHLANAAATQGVNVLVEGRTAKDWFELAAALDTVC